VEPVIGHLKAEHRMGRNHLAHSAGDTINPVLAAVGYNFRLLLRWLALLAPASGRSSRPRQTTRHSLRSPEKPSSRTTPQARSDGPGPELISEPGSPPAPGGYVFLGLQAGKPSSMKTEW
jgi:hypothetical protein